MMTKIEKLRAQLELVQRIEDNTPSGVLADALIEVLNILEKRTIGFTNDKKEK